MIRTACWLPLVLAALSPTMESAHVLEMPQTLRRELETYTALSASLHRWFAIAGGVYPLPSIAAAWGRRSSFARPRDRRGPMSWVGRAPEARTPARRRLIDGSRVVRSNPRLDAGEATRRRAHRAREDLPARRDQPARSAQCNRADALRGFARRSPADGRTAVSDFAE